MRILKYFFISVLLILLSAEGLVRLKVNYLQSQLIVGKTDFSGSDYAYMWLPVSSRMNHRFWNDFLVGKPDPRLRTFILSPLFDQSMGSSMSVVDRYRLKPGQYQLLDFTRAEDQQENSKFNVHINSFGFRGKERSINKPKGTLRIISWGAYQTFGHGVDDEFTYPSQLENFLNKNKKNGYEVWNAGAQSVSFRAVERRIPIDMQEVKPDIAILEFGFADVAAMKNDTFLNPGARIFPAGSLGWRVSKYLFGQIYTSFLGRSYLVAMLSQKFVANGKGKNLEFWKTHMSAFLDKLEEKGIFAILMNPIAGGFEAKEYEDLVTGRKNAVFFNVKKFLYENKTDREAISQAFYKDKNWVDEFEGRTKKIIQMDGMHVYKKNFSHPNEKSHRLISEQLAKIILQRSGQRK